MSTMIGAAISTAVTIVIGWLFGYFSNAAKNYKLQRDEILKEIKQLKETQMEDMRNDLTNKFYVYDAMEEVEDYLVMAFRKKCERYFEMDGDTWIHPMYDKSFKWKLKKTGYLD
jgi:hypothetical protein